MTLALVSQPVRVVITFLLVGAAQAQLGLPYCDVRPNSTGAPSVTSASGSSDVLDDDFTLHCTGLPPQALGQFLVGRGEAYLPGLAGGIGVLCIGGPIGRITPAVQADATGTVALALDLGSVPHPSMPYAVVNGDTLRFQLWHRDTVGGGASSNTSRALRVAFGPTNLFDGRVHNIPATTYSLAVADYDGDGVLDVTAGSYEGGAAGTLALLRGDGGGDFALASTFDGGGAVIDHASADLDGDGRLDVLALVYAAGDYQLAWIRGLGAGTFALPVLSPLGTGSVELDLSDLDGDGDLDVVGRQRDPGVAVIVHQVALGAFRVVAEVPVGFESVATVIGDLDGDGAPEVLVANRRDDTIHVLRNAGNGTFPTRDVVGAGRDPSALDLADLDLDGDLDVVIGRATGTMTTNMSTLFNAGGVLGGRVDFSSKPYVSGVRAVDLDGDGDQDLVMATSTWNSIDTFTNDGTGMFTPLGSTTVGGDFPVDLEVGDFDRDGDLDLATIMRFADAMQVLLNEGAGTFPSAPSITVQGGLRLMSLVDVDGDGVRDLVDMSYIGPRVLLGQGAGAFGPPTTFAGEPQPAVLHVVDLDSDGDVDLFTANTLGSRCSVHEGFGNGTFAAPVTSRAPLISTEHELGDVDGDGLLDLVSLDRHTQTVTVQLQGPPAEFAAGQSFAVSGSSEQLFFADFDGDAALDVLVLSGGGHPSGELQLLAGDGLGGFTPATSQSWAFRFNTAVQGDLDADGDLDLAVLANFGAQALERKLLVLKNRGDGTFDAGPPGEVVARLPSSAGLFDVEGDGDLDLFVTYPSENYFVLHRSEAGLAFGERESYTGGKGPNSAQAADLDGDGDLDVVVGTAYGALVLMNRRY
jgi:hypothetical protein